MINEYIVNGSVASEKIVYDIKKRKLKRADIDKLAADPRISAGFIGINYKNKKNKQEWDKNYLESLLTIAVAESFNWEYLLYLDEVADYVSKATFKKRVVAGGLIVIVIIAGVIVFKYALSAQ